MGFSSNPYRKICTYRNHVLFSNQSTIQVSGSRIQKNEAGGLSIVAFGFETAKKVLQSWFLINVHPVDDLRSGAFAVDDNFFLLVFLLARVHGVRILDEAVHDQELMVRIGLRYNAALIQLRDAKRSNVLTKQINSQFYSSPFEKTAR